MAGSVWAHLPSTGFQKPGLNWMLVSNSPKIKMYFRTYFKILCEITLKLLDSPLTLKSQFLRSCLADLLDCCDCCLVKKLRFSVGRPDCNSSASFLVVFCFFQKAYYQLLPVAKLWLLTNLSACFECHKAWEIPSSGSVEKSFTGWSAPDWETM